MKLLIILSLFALASCGSQNTDDLPPELEPGSRNQSSVITDDDNQQRNENSGEDSDEDTSPIEGEDSCLKDCDSEGQIDEDKIPAALMNEIDKRLEASRYMSRNCKPSSYPGYEGLPTELCSYKMRDGAKGSVIMLNPSALQLAAWITDSCIFINKDVTSCGLKLFRSVLLASGGQFPVAGVVYEDLNGNGKSEAFAFRDGVTVKISSFGTGSEGTLSKQQLEDSIWATPKYTYRYARIVSTTREQYYRYMDRIGVEPVDVGTSSAGKRKNSWMGVIRYLYTSSWERNNNPLMRAWALSNHSRL